METINSGLVPMVVEQTPRGERALIYIQDYSKKGSFS